jgi:rhodanese-related sulfurtransferase
MFTLVDFRKHLIGVLVVLAALTVVSHSGKNVNNYKVNDVDVFGARQLVDSGALVIDVRGREQFNSRHIPGAISIPIEELRAGVPAKIAAEAKDKAIVVYCNQGRGRGIEGTAILNKAGFSSAVNLNGGIEAWAGAGYAAGKS